MPSKNLQYKKKRPRSRTCQTILTCKHIVFDNQTNRYFSAHKIASNQSNYKPNRPSSAIAQFNASPAESAHQFHLITIAPLVMVCVCVFVIIPNGESHCKSSKLNWGNNQRPNAKPQHKQLNCVDHHHANPSNGFRKWY